MAGSWPEDEYDVAESPLSRVDYKSQVFFNLDEPVVAEDDASDTDFESLDSDESGWGNGGIDDTIATDIDIRVAGGPNSSGGLGFVTGGMLRELFEEIDRANERRMGEIKEEGIESKPENDDEITREEILEGSEEVAVSEIESTITTRTEGELRGKIEEIFRMELGDEADRAFNSVPQSEIPTTAAEKSTEEATTTVPFIPTLQFQKTPPIPDELLEPPPIPSRSPSRPGTSMTNRKLLSDTPGIFAPVQPCDSTLSLPAVKLTGSSMSSPRSSRFFEDLGDPATTATSIEIPQDNPLSPPLPPSRKASDESSATEPLEKKEKKGKKEKKKGKSFSWTCGLEFLFKRAKSGKPKELKAPVSNKPRSISIGSLTKRQ